MSKSKQITPFEFLRSKWPVTIGGVKFEATSKPTALQQNIPTECFSLTALGHKNHAKICQVVIPTLATLAILGSDGDNVHVASWDEWHVQGYQPPTKDISSKCATLNVGDIKALSNNRNTGPEDREPVLSISILDGLSAVALTLRTEVGEPFTDFAVYQTILASNPIDPTLVHKTC